MDGILFILSARERRWHKKSCIQKATSLGFSAQSRLENDLWQKQPISLKSFLDSCPTTLVVSVYENVYWLTGSFFELPMDTRSVN